MTSAAAAANTAKAAIGGTRWTGAAGTTAAFRAVERRERREARRRRPSRSRHVGVRCGCAERPHHACGREAQCEKEAPHRTTLPKAPRPARCRELPVTNTLASTVEGAELRSDIGLCDGGSDGFRSSPPYTDLHRASSPDEGLGQGLEHTFERDRPIGLSCNERAVHGCDREACEAIDDAAARIVAESERELLAEPPQRSSTDLVHHNGDVVAAAAACSAAGPRTR